jgi:hypothetical protein
MAPSLANRGLIILLYDRSRVVRQRLHERWAAVAGVRVLDDAELAGLPSGSLDMVLINSVVQYLSEAEFDALLGDLGQLLRRLAASCSATSSSRARRCTVTSSAFWR